MGFNSRARMGRDSTADELPSQRGRFNSRARMGRDYDAAHLAAVIEVSIHAPAWGATITNSFLPA